LTISKKIYQFSAPCGELTNYIEFFSESSYEETARFTAGEQFNVKMFPSWTPTFWINLGAPYQVEMGKERYLVKPEKDILVVRDSIATRHNLPADHIFTVKFFPGGLEAILGISQAGLAGKIVDLGDLLPLQLIHRVKRSGNFERRMELLQDFFLLQYQHQKKKDHYLHLVRDSIDAYANGSMQYNTTEIAGKMFITSKTINRYFHQVIGTSPKKYFSIIRARTALTAYVANKAGFLPDRYGYHDMSHFYREMIRFTGKSVAAQT
jgi:AraC-like DNA-binding protein